MAFFLSANDLWAYDQHQIRHNLLHAYLSSVLNAGDCFLGSVKISSRLFVSEGSYMSRYGRWDGEIYESVLCALVENVLGFQYMHYFLFHQSQTWTTEDLTMRSIWYIGIMAHTDTSFRKALKDYFSSFKSTFGVSPMAMQGESLMLPFEIGRIVEQVKTAPMKERSLFLRAIIQRGTPQMLDPFLSIGINLDEGKIMENYLGTAAQCGKLRIVASLLDAGASSARAVPLLCHSEILPIADFDSLLSKFIDSLADVKVHLAYDDLPDPIVAILQNKHAGALRPNSVQCLLKNGAFSSSKLCGSQSTYVTHSYVLNAILYNQPVALEAILNYGVPLELNIQDIFCTDREWFELVGSYTWLTLAVELGQTACVKVLVENSGNIIELVKRQDAGGRRAISLAHSFATGLHPRRSVLHSLHWIKRRHEGEKEISASADTAIFNILQDSLGTGIEKLDSINTAAGEDLAHSPGTGELTFERRWDNLWEKPLHEALMVGLCFIGLYGVLIGYVLLRFVLLREQQHVSKALLFFCIVIPLGLLVSCCIAWAVNIMAFIVNYYKPES